MDFKDVKANKDTKDVKVKAVRVHGKVHRVTKDHKGMLDRVDFKGWMVTLECKVAKDHKAHLVFKETWVKLDNKVRKDFKANKV